MKHLVYACLFVLGVSYGLHLLSPDKAFYDRYKATEVQTVAVATIPPYCVGYEIYCDSLGKAGFQGEQIHIALAVGRSESGLRFVPGDQGLADRKWGWSYGPWQIRSVNLQRGTGQCRDLAELQKNDLDFHARCAFEISAGGTNWKPWTQFVNGNYKSHL
jgi:lysozyme-like protein